MNFHSICRTPSVGLLSVAALMIGMSVYTASATAQELLHSWSQLIPAGEKYNANIQIRAVVDKNVSCSDVTVKGDDMTVHLVQRDQPNLPEFFSFTEINLCTTVLTGQMINKPQNVAVAYKSEEKSLILPDISEAVALDNFVVVGDTGCRGGSSQSCDSNSTSPVRCAISSRT